MEDQDLIDEEQKPTLDDKVKKAANTASNVYIAGKAANAGSGGALSRAFGATRFGQAFNNIKSAVTQPFKGISEAIRDPFKAGNELLDKGAKWGKEKVFGKPKQPELQPLETAENGVLKPPEPPGGYLPKTPAPPSPGAAADEVANAAGAGAEAASTAAGAAGTKAAAEATKAGSGLSNAAGKAMSVLGPVADAARLGYKAGKVGSDAANSSEDKSDLALDSADLAIDSGLTAAKYIAKYGAKKAGKDVAEDAVGGGGGVATGGVADAAVDIAGAAGVAGTTAVAAPVAAEGAGTVGAGVVAISGPVILIIIGILVVLAIIIGGFLIAMGITSQSTMDKNNPQDASIMNQTQTLVETGRLSFVDKNINDYLKEGFGNRNTFTLINKLANNHQNLVVDFGSAKGGTGIAIHHSIDKWELLSRASPFDFGVKSVDSIKCTDTETSQKFSEFPIELSQNYDWTTITGGATSSDGSVVPDSNTPAMVLPSKNGGITATGKLDKIKCGVGYYPGLETKVEGKFSKSVGPGEFLLSTLEASGPKAAAEKSAEIVSEILATKSTATAQTANSLNLLPDIVEVDPPTYTAVLPTLANDIKSAYPASTADTGVVSKATAYGVNVRMYK